MAGQLASVDRTDLVRVIPLQTDSTSFTTTTPSSRRRFQDFKFLRDLLVRDFPAAIVPPLPDKHRMGQYN